MSFNTNNTDYEIVTDADLATIISHFDKDVIIDTVRDSLRYIYRPYLQSLPNLVYSYEMSFNSNENLSEYLMGIRSDTYDTIIYEICKYFNLALNEEYYYDKYSLAYVMYDFFISNFTTYMIEFFTKYLIDDAINIYNDLNLSDVKKSKDSSTLYSKKVFSNQYIGAVFANIPTVLRNVVLYDINIYDIFDKVYDVSRAELLKNAIGDRGNFFKEFYVKYILNEEFLANNLTMIKLNLQANSEMEDINILKPQEVTNQ